MLVTVLCSLFRCLLSRLCFRFIGDTVIIFEESVAREDTDSGHFFDGVVSGCGRFI